MLREENMEDTRDQNSENVERSRSVLVLGWKS